METKTELINKNLPLKWVFDGDGEWHAMSMIIDPEMVDEPSEEMCREWCLMWRIVVLEDGSFFAGHGESDSLLLESKQIRTKSFENLASLKNAIDMAEEDLRVDEIFNNGKPIRLLPADKYKA